MVKKIFVVVPAMLIAAGIPCLSQQAPDPKASDMTGNGPPAWVMTKDKADPTAPPPGSKADQKKAATERPVSGFITDADGKPVVGAVVQLKNTRTLQIRSFITRDKGDYFFAGLNKDVDFELKAVFNGKTSAQHTLSSFDTRATPVINLQIK
jgi:hypothetical protein